MTLVLFAFLAAVYLTVEAEEPELREDFRSRALVAGLTVPEYFFFPLGISYLTYGLVRFAVLGLAERPEAEAVTLQPDDQAHQEHLP